MVQRGGLLDGIMNPFDAAGNMMDGLLNTRVYFSASIVLKRFTLGYYNRTGEDQN